MAIATNIPEQTRRIRYEVNRAILRRSTTLLDKVRFRVVAQSEEGMEVDGFQEFNLNSSVKHIDFSRLTVPWRMLSLAMLNQQVLVKKFIVVPEVRFYVVLDLSRSMRYPLIRLYGGDTIETSEIPQIVSAKINLLKLVGGAVIKGALDSGYSVQVVTFGAHGIVMEKPMQHHADLMSIFRRIDDRMDEVTQRPQSEESRYEEVAREFMNMKGKFLFVGDFMDPAFTWDDEEMQRKWLRMLGFFREWALHRPLGVIRVNHFAEVRAMGEDLRQRGRMVHPMGDRCDVDVERSGHTNESIAYEHFTRCAQRLRMQKLWERELTRALRASCSGYLDLNNRTYDLNLRQQMNHFGHVWPACGRQNPPGKNKPLRALSLQQELSRCSDRWKCTFFFPKLAWRFTIS